MCHTRDKCLSWAVQQPQILGKADPHGTSVNTHCVHLEGLIPQLPHQPFCTGCLHLQAPDAHLEPALGRNPVTNSRPLLALNPQWSSQSFAETEPAQRTRGDLTFLQEQCCCKDTKHLTALTTPSASSPSGLSSGITNTALTALAEWIKEALLGCSAENNPLSSAGSDCFLT